MRAAEVSVFDPIGGITTGAAVLLCPNSPQSLDSMHPKSLSLLAALAVGASALADVPQIIRYQGHVTVNGTPYTGTGLFKFSLISGDGAVTFWSNDGTASNGLEPAAAVAIPVNNGVYAVGLGDTSLSNMAPLSSTVFTNSSVWLRVWISDQHHGMTLIQPDQRITSVAYAMVAGTVPDGAITADKIAPGAVSATQLAQGSVGAVQLATNSVGANQIVPGSIGTNQLATGLAALLGGGQNAVPAGGIVMSFDGNSASLIRAGYVNVGLFPFSSDRWLNRATGPGPRQMHSAVWTGTEMIIFGGGDGIFREDGSRYNPASNSWTATTLTGAPSGRWQHRAAWTGTEMLVWGGKASANDLTGHLGDGARYNPITDTWVAMQSAGAPLGRADYAAVWTGTEFLVWGGSTDGSADTRSGARYSPATDTWAAMSTNGAPSPREAVACAWTGTEMIIWGGASLQGDGYTLNNAPIQGARYNPTNNTWIPMTTNGAPRPRFVPFTAWTGTEMLVWGGIDGDSSGALTVAEGARYNPVSDTWSPISTTNAPSARAAGASVWTGAEWVIWGGFVVTTNGTTRPTDGARYNPATDIWRPLTADNPPAGRTDCTTVWTGQAMIVFGGYGSDGTANSTDAWNPGQLYLYERR